MGFIQKHNLTMNYQSPLKAPVDEILQGLLRQVQSACLVSQQLKHGLPSKTLTCYSRIANFPARKFDSPSFNSPFPVHIYRQKSIYRVSAYTRRTTNTAYNVKKCIYIGRAIPKAVSRWFPTAAARVQTRV
jgi:hypothetical protein